MCSVATRKVNNVFSNLNELQNKWFLEFKNEMEKNNMESKLILKNIENIISDGVDQEFFDEFISFLGKEILFSREYEPNSLYKSDFLEKVKKIYLNNIDYFSRVPFIKRKMIYKYLSSVFNKGFFNNSKFIDSNLDINKVIFIAEYLYWEEITDCIFSENITNDNFYDFIKEKFPKLDKRRISIFKKSMDNVIDFTHEKLLRFLLEELDIDYIDKIVKERIEFEKYILSNDFIEKMVKDCMNETGLFFFLRKFYMKVYRSLFKDENELYVVIKSKNMRVLPFIYSFSLSCKRLSNLLFCSLLIEKGKLNGEIDEGEFGDDCYYSFDYIEYLANNVYGSLTKEERKDIQDAILYNLTEHFDVCMDDIYFYKNSLRSYKDKVYNLFKFIDFLCEEGLKKWDNFTD